MSQSAAVSSIEEEEEEDGFEFFFLVERETETRHGRVDSKHCATQLTPTSPAVVCLNHTSKAAAASAAAAAAGTHTHTHTFSLMQLAVTTCVCRGKGLMIGARTRHSPVTQNVLLSSPGYAACAYLICALRTDPVGRSLPSQLAS